MSTLDYDTSTVQSDKPVQRRTTKGTEGEVLSPVEAAAVMRGQTLKRYVRSAAAMQGLYDDTALAEAVGRTRIAVGKWWRGAKPEPDAIRALAEATGLSISELGAFVYYDGPPPRLPIAEEEEAQDRAASAERSAHAPPASEASEAPHAPRETTGSGR